MDFKKEFIEGGVERLKLNGIECCALAHAFAKNSRLIKQIKEAVDPELLKAAVLPLPKSQHIAFPRNDKIDLAYSQAAQVEIERLKNLTAVNLVEWNKHAKEHPHSVEEHIAALESVIEKTSGGPLTTKN